MPWNGGGSFVGLKTALLFTKIRYKKCISRFGDCTRRFQPHRSGTNFGDFIMMSPVTTCVSLCDHTLIMGHEFHFGVTRHNLRQFDFSGFVFDFLIAVLGDNEILNFHF